MDCFLCSCLRFTLQKFNLTDPFVSRIRFSPADMVSPSGLFQLWLPLVVQFLLIWESRMRMFGLRR